MTQKGSPLKKRPMKYFDFGHKMIEFPGTYPDGIVHVQEKSLEAHLDSSPWLPATALHTDRITAAMIPRLIPRDAPYNTSQARL